MCLVNNVIDSVESLLTQTLTVVVLAFLFLLLTVKTCQVWQSLSDETQRELKGRRAHRAVTNALPPGLD
jgi:hypothetical protein